MTNHPEVPSIIIPDPRIKTLHDLHGIEPAMIAEILGNPTASPHMNRALRLSLGETLPKSGELYPSVETPLAEDVRKNYKLTAFEGTNPAFPGATIMGNCTIGTCTPIAMQNAVSSGEEVEEKVGLYTRYVREKVVSYTGDKLGDGEFMYFDYTSALKLGKLPSSNGVGDSWKTMNTKLLGDKDNYYNLARILQLPFNGCLFPAADHPSGAGDFTRVGSADFHDQLHINLNYGSVDTEGSSYNGCNVRLLDTK